VRTGLIGDEAPARALELGRCAIFIGLLWWSSAVPIITKHLGALQIGPAEFPEAAADGVDHARGHVDRAEAAVRGVVGRAELRARTGRSSACIWSRPVKSANFFGSVARIWASRVGQHVVGLAPS
jgi:hypothetical protein